MEGLGSAACTTLPAWIVLWVTTSGPCGCTASCVWLCVYWLLTFGEAVRDPKDLLFTAQRRLGAPM